MSVPTTQARDYNPLLDLTPKSVAAFLSVTGWDRAQSRRDISQVWVSPDRESSLLLPLDTSFNDFRERFLEALTTVSFVHRSSGEALALEIASASSDILLLRADQQTRNGTIPLLEAQELLDGARKMITAAAVSTVRPRATTAGRRPNRVNEFIGDEVRMGHTLRGSFVLTIFADLGSDVDVDNVGVDAADLGVSGGEAPTTTDSQPQTEPSPAPFGRRVFNTLAHGLAAANSVLADKPDSIDDDTAVRQGVSAELVEALAEMSSSEGVKALDMAFRWSPAEHRLTVPQQESRVIVTRESTIRAESVVRRLRRKDTTPARQMVGFVTRLERSPDDEDGVAFIEGTFDDPEIKSRTLRVPLRGTQYRNAIRAHERRYPVVVSGNFTRTSKGYVAEGLTTIRQALEPSDT